MYYNIVRSLLCINQSDTLFVKKIIAFQTNNQDTWFKTWIPSIIPLIVLLVTNLVVLYKIKLDSKESLKKEIIISKIKIDRERLEKFYDPIYTILKTNSDIFNSYGPNTFPGKTGTTAHEAAELWKQMIRNIIIPNNRKICETIKSFSHLIIDEDNLESYLIFLKHAESYEHFINFPNDIHSAFKYPITFIENVETNRGILLSNLSEIEKKLTN